MILFLPRYSSGLGKSSLVSLRFFIPCGGKVALSSSSGFSSGILALYYLIFSLFPEIKVPISVYTGSQLNM